MRRLLLFVREERGSASVLEHSVVLPLCFIMIASVLALGFLLHRRAVIDIVAAEAAQIATKEYAATYISAGGDPYRYLNGGYNKELVHSRMRESVLSKLGSSADVEIVDNGIGTKRRIRVVVSQPYGLFTLSSSFERTLICPAADIRNADFIMHLGLGIE